MSKIAFLFPGQGAQYVGMGKDFYENIPVCKEVMDLASEASGLNIQEICFEENDKINITEYTQIAMLSVSAAILAAVKAQGITSCVNAGLSLGEYGALVASEALTMEDAFRLVRKRGIYMQEEVPVGGAMSAVLGMDAAVIEEICGKTEGIVSIANYNCPGQIVITGEEDAVTRAGAALKKAGARRVMPLKVSGPFHSAMLKGAGEKLGQELEHVQIQKIQTPYVTNVTAEYVTDEAEVKDLLTRQVSSPVKWQQSVEHMIAQGVDTFVEIGPGKTLTGFMRKINKDVKAMNIQKIEDFETVMNELK